MAPGNQATVLETLTGPVYLFCLDLFSFLPIIQDPYVLKVYLGFEGPKLPPNSTLKVRRFMSCPKLDVLVILRLELCTSRSISS